MTHRRLDRVLSKNRDVAGLIIEPVLANMGLILPEKRFLSDVRKITKQHDVPLIFDEVVTGFRVSEGGAQKTFKIKPDITTLGKALGNGFTIAAVGGKKEIMNKLAPGGNVYQASTFAGNPVSVTAAINSIKTINKMKNSLYEKLERNCELLVDEIDDLATDYNIPHQINSIASMFQIFFSSKPVVDYKTSKKSNTKKFHKLFSGLLKNGVFIAPSQYETVFLSDAHSDVDLTKTLGAYGLSLKVVKKLTLVGTRGSKLSLAQTNWVLTELKKENSGIKFEIKTITTTGDTDTRALFTIDQKGIFEKEIDKAVAEKQIDFAVHSLKDVPSDISKSLTIACIPKRESVNDVFITKDGSSLETIPSDSVIGTSSLRRAVQISRKRPDVKVKPVRGNIETRINKVIDDINLMLLYLHTREFLD